MKANDIFMDERPTERDERHPVRGRWRIADSRAFRWAGLSDDYIRFSILLLIVIWGVQFAVTSAMVAIEGQFEPGPLYVPRLFVTAGNFVVSLAMLAILYVLRERSLAMRGITATALALVAPVASTAVNFGVFYGVFHLGQTDPLSISALAQDYMFRMWTFASIAALFLALSYAADIREREKRINMLQSLAHNAQLRALRYQLNPHFLFNALNSIAGLMRSRRAGEAEAMTENLADFLRTTLELDPQSMIPLAEELRLQDLYLAIEKVRFPDRLKVVTDVPKDLSSIPVPSLILQPLIENSIKYAVAKSAAPVTVSIIARRSGDAFSLTIADDGGDADPCASSGSNVGLRNIAERLDAHYGGLATFEAGPRPDGGYATTVTLPLESAA